MDFPCDVLKIKINNLPVVICIHGRSKFGYAMQLNEEALFDKYIMFMQGGEIKKGMQIANYSVVRQLRDRFAKAEKKNSPE
jgi:hypothetical protein